MLLKSPLPTLLAGSALLCYVTLSNCVKNIFLCRLISPQAFNSHASFISFFRVICVLDKINKKMPYFLSTDTCITLLDRRSFENSFSIPLGPARQDRPETLLHPRQAQYSRPGYTSHENIRDMESKKKRILRSLKAALCRRPPSWLNGKAGLAVWPTTVALDHVFDHLDHVFDHLDHVFDHQSRNICGKEITKTSFMENMVNFLPKNVLLHLKFLRKLTFLLFSKNTSLLLL